VRYIGTNRTMYSRDDLNDAIEAFLSFTRNVPELERLCPEFRNWKFTTLRRHLPIKLQHWKNWTKTRSLELRDLSDSSAAFKIRMTKGPWFVDNTHMPDRYRTPLSHVGIIRPKDIPDIVNGMEALSTVHFMPDWAVAQFVFYCHRNMGIALQSESQILSCAGHSDELSLLIVCQDWVQREKIKVRILPRIEDTLDEVRPSREQHLQQLYKTYTEGGVKQGMDYKEWTLRHAAEQYADFWKQSEVQRRRAERKGIKIEQPHLSPAEMLKKLAQQYDSADTNNTPEKE